MNKQKNIDIFLSYFFCFPTFKTSTHDTINTMKIVIASGSISSISIIQSLASTGELMNLIIPEPYELLRQTFGQFLKSEKILNSSKESASCFSFDEEPDLFISIGYPYKIGFKNPQTKGLNVHFGPLPENRGPDPLFWTLRDGKRVAYICIHEISEAYDAGKILIEKGHTIMPEENYGLLYSRLGILAVPMIQELMEHMPEAKIQDESKTIYRKKPTPEDCTINWDIMEATEIENLINACNPRQNGAITTMNGTVIRILEAFRIESGHFKNITGSQQPGSVVLANHEGVFVKCKNDEILRLNIVMLNEGYFSGAKLTAMGVNENIKFV